jgi:prolyl-tRNA synthetase
MDEEGESKLPYMGCYGIGTSRLMGVLVEKFHDDKGIIWPKSVAPFQVYLAGLNRDDAEIVAKTDDLYAKLLSKGIEVLYDDRDINPGAKFSDADLLGIPYRIVVSKKTGDQIELKARNEKDSHLIDIAPCIQKLKE